MKNSLIPLAAVILALVATSAGVLALTGGDEPSGGQPPIGSTGIEPRECNHNIVDGCDQADLDGHPDADKDGLCEPVPLRSDCGIDPDECNFVHNINACDQDDLDRLGEDGLVPIASPEQEPSTQAPIRSDDGIALDECNQIHNIDACGEILNPPGIVDEPSGDDSNYFQVKVQFNTSVTQDHIDEADAFLRTFDDDLEFIIMEISPPIGSVLLDLETSDECSTIEAQLEAESYVAGVSCEPWQPNGEVESGELAEQTN